MYSMKEHEGVWDREERIWTITHNNYYRLLDKVTEYCKEKGYQCQKIPSFVYDAQLDMPNELVVKTSRSRGNSEFEENYVITYTEIEKHMEPETLPFFSKLYDFQRISLQFGLEHHGRLLLADEMGVGKTLQSLAIAYMYRYEWPMVVICPSTLRFNWMNEILQWYGESIKKNEVQVYLKGGTTLKDGVKILIISYDLAWKYKEVWSQFKVAIVDEAHYLKNSGCKRTDILVPELSRKRRVILLTGTPAFARPREIFNLAVIVRPDAFTNFLEFGNRYCEPTRNPWSGMVEYNGCKNSKELFFLLKNKIMIRRMKKDVLTQLPDKQRQKIIIETNKNITKEINSLMDGGNHGGKNAEDVIMEMFGLQNAKSEDYQQKRESIMEAYRLSGMAKIEGVIEYILELLENNVKLLIFAHHKAVLDKIQTALHTKKYQTIRIDGEVETLERQNRVDAFQTNKEIMAALLSISAAGVGLTLTASSTVIFAELHWTPGLMIQAEDRAHRIGQKNCVNCHYLIGENTIDGVLYNYLLKKINNVSTFVDGVEKQLEIEELSKGEKGKYSKTLNSDKKERFSSGKKFTINPIRKSVETVHIDIDGNEVSETTDIESQLNSNFWEAICSENEVKNGKNSKKSVKTLGENHIEIQDLQDDELDDETASLESKEFKRTNNENSKENHVEIEQMEEEFEGFVEKKTREISNKNKAKVLSVHSSNSSSLHASDLLKILNQPQVSSNCEEDKSKEHSINSLKEKSNTSLRMNEKEEVKNEKSKNKELILIKSIRNSAGSVSSKKEIIIDLEENSKMQKNVKKEKKLKTNEKDDYLDKNESDGNTDIECSPSSAF